MNGTNIMICFTGPYDPLQRALAQLIGIAGVFIILVVAWKNKWRLPYRAFEKALLFSPFLILLINGLIGVIEQYLGLS